MTAMSAEIWERCFVHVTTVLIALRQAVSLPKGGGEESKKKDRKRDAQRRRLPGQSCSWSTRERFREIFQKLLSNRILSATATDPSDSADIHHWRNSCPQWNQRGDRATWPWTTNRNSVLPVEEPAWR